MNRHEDPQRSLDGLYSAAKVVRRFRAGEIPSEWSAERVDALTAADLATASDFRAWVR